MKRNKRRDDEAIQLAYHSEMDEPVFIPDNLFVVGTMNIADRSLALVDLALRRRLCLRHPRNVLNDRWKPGAATRLVSTTSSLEHPAPDHGAERRDRQRSITRSQFRIGHSYVTPAKDDKIDDARHWFRQIVETEIGPLLDEYWYDSP